MLAECLTDLGFDVDGMPIQIRNGVLSVAEFVPIKIKLCDEPGRGRGRESLSRAVSAGHYADRQKYNPGKQYTKSDNNLYMFYAHVIN